MSEEKLEEVISEKPQENTETVSEKGVAKRKIATRKRKIITSTTNEEETPIKKRKPRTTRKKIVKPSEDTSTITENTEDTVPQNKVVAARKAVKRNVITRKVVQNNEATNDDSFQ
ncbi:MAG: hypothetical protein JJE21_02650, partial [Spirochaetaceae bacterium]|nr:hypothetical protein [Spirochaetaceae bacterium]